MSSSSPYPGINWTLLNLWAFGWGVPSLSSSSTLIPSPDALVSILTLLWLLLFTLNQRGKRYSVRHTTNNPLNDKKAYRYDSHHQYSSSSSLSSSSINESGAGNYEILPLFFPLLRTLSIGLGGLFVFSLSLYLLLLYGNPSSILYQLIIQYSMNTLRIFIFEVLTHTITFFFLQSSLTYQALYRAMVPASLWSTVYTLVHLILMIRYVRTDLTSDDGDIPRYIITGLNLCIVMFYITLVLTYRKGRLSVRSYLWYTIVWRTLLSVGLLFSAIPNTADSSSVLLRDASLFNFVFDILFMIIQIVGLPCTLYITLLADTYYWRGYGRIVPSLKGNSTRRNGTEDDEEDTEGSNADVSIASSSSFCSFILTFPYRMFRSVWFWCRFIYQFFFSEFCGIGDIGIGLGLRQWKDDDDEEGKDNYETRKGTTTSSSSRVWPYLYTILCCGSDDFTIKRSGDAAEEEDHETEGLLTSARYGKQKSIDDSRLSYSNPKDTEVTVGFSTGNGYGTTVSSPVRTTTSKPKSSYAVIDYGSPDEKVSLLRSPSSSVSSGGKSKFVNSGKVTFALSPLSSPSPSTPTMPTKSSSRRFDSTIIERKPSLRRPPVSLLQRWLGYYGLSSSSFPSSSFSLLSSMTLSVPSDLGAQKQFTSQMRKWTYQSYILSDNEIIALLMRLLEEANKVNQRALNFAYLVLRRVEYKGAEAGVLLGFYRHQPVAVKIATPLDVPDSYMLIKVFDEAEVNLRILSDEPSNDVWMRIIQNENLRYRQFIQYLTTTTTMNKVSSLRLPYQPYIDTETLALLVLSNALTCIPYFYGICSCPPDVSLVFEWCNQGSLRTYLDSLIIKKNLTIKDKPIHPTLSTATTSSTFADHSPDYTAIKYIAVPLLDCIIVPEKYRTLTSTASTTTTIYHQYRHETWYRLPSSTFRTLSPSSTMSSSSATLITVPYIFLPPSDWKSTVDETLIEAEIKHRIRLVPIPVWTENTTRKINTDDDGDGNTKNSSTMNNQEAVAYQESRLYTLSSFHPYDKIRILDRFIHQFRLPDHGSTKNKNGSTLSGTKQQERIATTLWNLGGIVDDAYRYPYYEPLQWPVDDILYFPYGWQTTLEYEIPPVPPSNVVSNVVSSSSSTVTSTTMTIPLRTNPSTFSSSSSAFILSWLQRLIWALQIIRGLGHLHSLSPPLLHRDIKSLNIFLTENNSSTSATSTSTGTLRHENVNQILKEIQQRWKQQRQRSSASIASPAAASSSRLSWFHTSPTLEGLSTVPDTLTLSGVPAAGNTTTTATPTAKRKKSTSPTSSPSSSVPYLSLYDILYDTRQIQLITTVPLSAKLGDFGDSRSIRSGYHTPMTKEKGTPQWMAPEVMSGKEYYKDIEDTIYPSSSSGLNTEDNTETMKNAATNNNNDEYSEPSTVPYSRTGIHAAVYGTPADIYSYGIILWEIITGGMPYTSLPRRGQLVENIATHYVRLPIPTYLPRSLSHLLRMCWHPDPELRPTAWDIQIILSKMIHYVFQRYLYVRNQETVTAYNRTNGYVVSSSVPSSSELPIASTTEGYPDDTKERSPSSSLYATAPEDDEEFISEFIEQAMYDERNEPEIEKDEFITIPMSPLILYP